MKGNCTKLLSIVIIASLLMTSVILFAANPVKADPDPIIYTFVDKWGTEGSGESQFRDPYAVAVDQVGNVYVADTSNQRIQKFTSDGTYITQWGSYGSGNGQFISPWAIAVDKDGNVYVGEFIPNQRIQKFTSDGTYITQWGSYGSGDGQFDGPRGIAFDSIGNVYVTDTNHNRIEVFTSDGQFISEWGGSGDNQISAPIGICFDTLGNVYVADQGNSRIEKFTSDGTFITNWGSYGSSEGQLNTPAGIAIDANGNLLVTEVANHRVQMFTSEGVSLGTFGIYGSDNGQFYLPLGIAINGDGNVYVVEVGNSRVQKFALDTSADFDYQLINGGTEVEITGYHGSGGDVEIPSLIEEKPVTSIGDFGFAGINSLTSVIIPEGVRNIGSHAFYGSNQLVHVNVPSTVEYIGIRAFSIDWALTAIDVSSENPTYASMDGVLYNKAFTKLIQYPGGKPGVFNIPDSVTSIGDISFDNCPALSSVTIPGCVTYIGYSAFSGCTSLGSVMISEGVTTISGNMFAGCYSLNSVTIPNSLTNIGGAAFWKCSSLTSIIIPASVTYIGGEAFNECHVMTEIAVSTDNDNYASIDGVLYDKSISTLIQCPGGKTGVISIPYGVISIGDCAFVTCFKLTSVIIPETVLSIGYAAFYQCRQMTSIIIPDKVSYIGLVAFSMCDSLVQIYFNGDAPNCHQYWINIFNSNLVIYYYYGATGFTTPIWYGISCVCIGSNSPPTITELNVPLNPIIVNGQVSTSATFTDLDDGDTHTALWSWGDETSTSEGVVDESIKTVTGLHTYATPGIYSVSLTVTDYLGASASTTALTYVVVYDPAGGFVTGGGWITSPEGAYLADSTLTGKASFGFVAKYQKGATIPTGNTEFQFQMAGLNFHSTSYNWLVVNQGGTNAQFKGDGTINGAVAPNGQNYKFMIWAGDHSPDTFRIKIWWEDSSGEHLVYDNGVQQAIGGGSIVVHTK